ncbi:MAG: hypothetical protein NTZ26_09385 [Candidatus Aminicenantes bacterium]|nr:hypothetical protein [Candidatus Aminicenantes bacterium]
MKKTETRTAISELPEDVQGLIQSEIESGLAQFRAGDFKGKLRAAMRAEEHSHGTRRPRKSALLRWAPVYGLALAAAVIGIAVLFSNHRPAPDPTILASTLETLPGIQSLNLAPLDLTHIPVSAAPSNSPLFAPLSAAAAQAEADAAITVPSIPVLIPRYTLEEKIEILTKEQPIERALTLLKSKSGEV